jgi:hypothetical protein
MAEVNLEKKVEEISVDKLERQNKLANCNWICMSK